MDIVDFELILYVLHPIFDHILIEQKSSNPM